MAASNTKEVFREVIGKKVVGVYWERNDHGEAAVLVLDDGSGLAFNHNGSHWNVSAEDIALRVQHRRMELARAYADLNDILKVEGVLGDPKGT